MDAFLATILLWAGNYNPNGWAFCMGQLLSISQNTALFSLLGTTFGGNGQTTFGLPDFRGRVPVGAGQGPGLASYVLGQMAGTENTTLTVNQLPAHTHAVTLTMKIQASNAQATSSAPTNPSANVLAAPYDTLNANAIAGYNNQAPSIALNTGTGSTATAAVTGGSQPFSILQPYLGINYIICLQGIFPPRG
jgi:microcystin-dependent protein